MRCRRRNEDRAPPRARLVRAQLKARRESLGLTLADVARQIRDVSEGACLLTYNELGRLERGDQACQVGKLLWVAQALDLSVDIVPLRSP